MHLVSTDRTRIGPAGEQSHASKGPSDALPYSTFIWGAGIECSFLPHLEVDQFQWTQHDRFWREDFRLAKEELGIQHLRYAFRWHRLEPRRREFDWSAADERMAELDKLGIEVYLDVMHFGTPLWLKQAVGDVEFPEALERFTEAMVGRYGGQVKTWCPFNEPLVSALFSGDFGFWPPHSRQWRGYMPVLSRIVQAVNRSIRAIRRAAPEATVLLVDNVESYKSREPSLAAEVRRRNLRRFLVLDLLGGRVDGRHPLYQWLTSYGMSEIDLEWFRTNPRMPDVLGLDYYPHSDWQLDQVGDSVQQRRAENPVGLYGVAKAYYQRYGLPMLMTETSIEGKAINREIWFDTTVQETRRLREEGVPLLGYFWWPMIDQVDWDGALTHRIGKVHHVGLFSLQRQADGTLARRATSMVKRFRAAAEAKQERVGELAFVRYPTETVEDQGPVIGINAPALVVPGGVEGVKATLVEKPAGKGKHNGNGKHNGDGNGHATAARRLEAPAPGASGEPAAGRMAGIGSESTQAQNQETGEYGIVVISHLRWGFVWQRPQQFLSRFARKHRVLFIEEPMFDLPEGQTPRYDLHRVMPNVVVSCPHLPRSWNENPQLPDKLREFARSAINDMNEDGAFDRPLLWYYSPMDASWSLGAIENRGVVYDSMDELSQFTGAPKELVANERRLMEHADIVFAGGYELWLSKKQRHDNAHFFGCGVEYDHFAQAQEQTTAVPADIDFMSRPILGWFGVIDERLDYALIEEMARKRPAWSFAMVGPVVKVDPNHLPHAPNLFWLGGRDYQVLPSYCRAFDVCMMPFALNKATEFINPTKVLEYFATGRPVISTPVKDVVRQYEGLVHIVANADEFLATAERCLQQPDPQRIEKCLQRARAGSWDATVEKMQRLIGEAIRPQNRPSAKKVEPVAVDVLSYTYHATQGS